MQKKKSWRKRDTAHCKFLSQDRITTLHPLSNIEYLVNKMCHNQ